MNKYLSLIYLIFLLGFDILIGGITIPSVVSSELNIFIIASLIFLYLFLLALLIAGVVSNLNKLFKKETKC